MRKIKKILCAALASTMVLAMAAPSFAVEGDGSSIPATSLTTPTTKPSTANTKGAIAIDNPVTIVTKDEETGAETRTLADYTAYKIFDVTYTGEGQYAYSIPASSPWFQYLYYEVSGGLDDTEFSSGSSVVDGLTFTKAASGDVYYVAVDESEFSAAEFAQILKTIRDEAEGEVKTKLDDEGKKLTVTEDGAAATGLPLGYYFVTTTSGALCNLTTTNPNVVIHDKNEAPTIEKTASVDEGSVEIGDKIPYTITGKVTNLEGYSEYIYEVSDTMSNGLTLLNSGNDRIKVTIDGEEITLTREELNISEHGFTLTLDLVELGASFGDDIVITYTALVNSAAANGTDPVTNTAKLTYSNDPATDGKGETTEQKVELYTSKLVIDKYANDNKENKLEGATFVLQNEKGEYYQYVEAKAATDTAPAVEAKVDWVTNIDQATKKTTDNQGAAEFIGLKDGTYYLVETEAPAGYNLLADRVEVSVLGLKDGGFEEDDIDPMGLKVVYALTTTKEVANSTGTILPSTGGIGTTIFYAAGIILMAGAVFFVVRRKRA